MKSIINWVVQGWQKLLAYIGIAAVVFAIGGWTGYKYATGQEAKKEVAAVIKAVEMKDNNQKSADKAGDDVVKEKEKVRIVFKTIEKEVIKYEKTNPNAATQCLDDDWVLLHNKAASGENITASPGRVESGSQGKAGTNSAEAKEQ